MFRALLRGGLVLAGLALAGPALAQKVTDDRIKKSVEAGVNYLKAHLAEQTQYDEGANALAGLALLEAKVPPEDPAIQRLAHMIRKASVGQYKTYQLALDIMFLDRLGEDDDDTLIQSMGARLKFGQTKDGGWSYNCPNVDQRERDRLEKKVQESSLKGTNKPPALKPSEPKTGSQERDPDVLDIVNNPRTRLVFSENQNGDDNSNTQFAILGLWAARRHGLIVDEELRKAEQRFRSSQNQGGWGYMLGQSGTGTMTCAGLLALAVGIGNKQERSLKAAASVGGSSGGGGAPKEVKPPDPMKDQNVVLAYNFLGACIKGNNLSPFGMGGGLGRPGGGAGAGMMHIDQPGATNDIRHNLYFLWSVERASMVFGWNTIGGVNWHLWGCEYILAHQRNDGSWTGEFKELPSTSFAVMFLCRANLFKDLTGMLDRSLKGSAKAPIAGSRIKDPAKGPGATVPTTPAEPPDAAKLARELTSSTAAQQAELIKKYAEGKGGAYTEALATSIPDMTAESQKLARRALADRLGKFSANTLRQYMEQDLAELRRAAAIAAAEREEQELVPDLIKLLADREDVVVRGARLALKSLTENDFGPPLGADEAAKKKAIEDWNKWLKTRAGK